MKVLVYTQECTLYMVQYCIQILYKFEIKFPKYVTIKEVWP